MRDRSQAADSLRAAPPPQSRHPGSHPPGRACRDPPPRCRHPAGSGSDPCSGWRGRPRTPRRAGTCSCAWGTGSDRSRLLPAERRLLVGTRQAERVHRLLVPHQDHLARLVDRHSVLGRNRVGHFLAAPPKPGREVHRQRGRRAAGATCRAPATPAAIAATSRRNSRRSAPAPQPHSHPTRQQRAGQDHGQPERHARRRDLPEPAPEQRESPACRC